MTTKADLAQAVQERLSDLSAEQARELVADVLDLMKDALAGGENLKISGFGNFVLNDKAQRRGRNPQTGEPLLLDARRVVTFKPSPVLRSRMNGD